MNDILNFNAFNTIIIGGTIQGVIFSLVVLFTKKYKSPSNFYLAQVILYLSLNNLYYWFADTNLSNRFEYFEKVYIPWNLLILPVFYYYVTSYLKGKKELLRVRNYLLFPFFISLGIHIILLIFEVFSIEIIPQAIQINRRLFYAEEYFSSLFTVFIIYKTFKIIKKYRKEHQNYSPNEVTTETKWIKQLLYFGIYVCFIWILVTMASQLLKIDKINYFGNYILWLSVSFLVYWLGYLGIYYNGIFNQRQQIRFDNVPKIILPKQKEVVFNYNKFEEIDIYIKREELFLNPNLCLTFIAGKFGLSEGYLSQLINNFSDDNFSAYINKLRVEKAKTFLINSEYKNYTVVSVALESGFNSKSAFYNAFRKETGFSPTEFRKNNLS